MRKKRSGLSLGSILTLCLTAAVVAGCVFLFGIIRGEKADVAMDTQRMIGAVHSFMQGSQDAQPQATVRTVTVTLAPVTTPQPTPVPVQETAAPQPALLQPFSFTLTAGGLLSFQSEVSDSVYNKSDKTIDYVPVVEPLHGKIYADMNLVTLPQTLNVTDRKYSDTMAPAEAAAAIQALGFDQVALGTEHILDQARQGAMDTISALQRNRLSCTGVNVQDVSQMRLVQINGGTAAILSFTDVLTSKSRNALSKEGNLLALYDADTARRLIQSARNQGARCVIVCMYWGKTDAASVTAAQKNTARELAEMGADVILGTRPSRVLPMELVLCTGEDGKQRTAFVAYSLGTLLTESRDGQNISGMLLHLSLRSDEQGMMHFESIEYTPTYIWRQSANGKMQYRLVCSADPAPAGMTDQQKDVMKRALTRIQEALKDSPAAQRP